MKSDANSKNNQRDLEKAAIKLANANVALLSVQEQLEEKNKQLKSLLNELSISRDELQAVLDSSNSAMLMVNPLGIVTSFNRQVSEYFDLKNSDITQKPFHDLLPKIKQCFKEPERFRQIIKQLEITPDKAYKKDSNYKEFFSRSLMTIRPVQRFLSFSSITVMNKENTQTLGRAWLFVDITDIKTADDKLRAIVEVSPIPYIISRVNDGKILYINKPLSDVTGFSEEELLERNTLEFYQESSDRIFIENIMKEKGYLYNHELRIKHKNGSFVWMILSIVKNEIGGEKVYIASLYNINARRNAEEALKVSETRFRSLVENATDIIFSMKPDNTFSYISPQFQEITGHKVRDFIGKTLESLIHPDDNITFKDNRNLDKHVEHNYRLRHKDGNWHWFISHTTGIYNFDGELLERIGIAHDVTEIKSVLSNLEQANQELRKTQAQLVQSEKMGALGMLVAGIAHEINTPVGAINSMHNTLVRAVSKLQNELSEKYPEILENNSQVFKSLSIINDANRVIESGTTRVTNIVKRLRSFARLDEAELKEANILDGIEDTLVIIHHEIKHDITIIKEFGELPIISCYPGRLNQVFLNLLINARQAISGKGEIKIKTEHKNNKIIVEITDNGKGIPPEQIDQIFNPGFTTKGVGVGTGLGLSICYQIIEDHKGTITVKSKQDVGTSFTVTIPTNLDQLLNQ